jgi:protein TonB
MSSSSVSLDGVISLSVILPSVFISSVAAVLVYCRRKKLVFVEEVKQVVEQVAVEEVKQEPFTIVEENPTFPGGEAAMFKFLQSHMQYPQYEKEADISGRVFVRFVVQADGSIDNVSITRKVSPGLDKEAMRVVQLMPKWNPGKQGGRAVPVWFNLPVNFVLN